MKRFILTAAVLLPLFLFASCNSSKNPETNVTPPSPAASAATIAASPNPVPAGEGRGTTTISWNTGDGTAGQVYVSVDGGAESPYGDGPQGTGTAPWIQTGKRYEFRLYAGTDHATVLAKTEVSRSTVAASLSASPNPVPAGSPNQALGKTTISWNTGDSSIGDVYVKVNRSPEVLVGRGQSGTLQVDWIGFDSLYEFRLYAKRNDSKLLKKLEVIRENPETNVTPPSPAASAATIAASPNPVPAGEGRGTTTISWNTGDGTAGQVYVSVDGGAESPYGDGPQGTGTAPWIQTGKRYEFRLYAGTDHATVLAKTEVSRSTVAASLSASPNPVPAGSPNQALGKTTISWNTGDSSIGDVYVKVNRSPEVLVGRGQSGTLQVDWIGFDSLYEFRLYAKRNDSKLLKKLEVIRDE